MKIDKFVAVELEQCDWPGSIGDSCAESSRLNRLLRKLDLSPVCDLKIFRTDLGYVRHPTAPGQGQLAPKADGSPSDSWRETDFTDDQATVWYMEMKETNPEYAKEMKKRVISSGFRTGKNIIHPGFLALLVDSKISTELFLYTQSLLFKLSYRWSDEKHQFEPNKTSAADYLNWIFMAADCDEWVRKSIDKEVLKSKVAEYYAKEPHSDWVVDLYNRFIDKYW